jgi:hypothetical protein
MHQAEDHGGFSLVHFFLSAFRYGIIKIVAFMQPLERH